MKPPTDRVKNILGHSSDALADQIRDPWNYENPLEAASFRMRLLQPDFRRWRLELVGSEIIEMLTNERT